MSKVINIKNTRTLVNSLIFNGVGFIDNVDGYVKKLKHEELSKYAKVYAVKYDSKLDKIDNIVSMVNEIKNKKKHDFIECFPAITRSFTKLKKY